MELSNHVATVLAARKIRGAHTRPPSRPPPSSTRGAPLSTDTPPSATAVPCRQKESAAGAPPPKEPFTHTPAAVAARQKSAAHHAPPKQTPTVDPGRTTVHPGHPRQRPLDRGARETHTPHSPPPLP